MPPGVMRGRLLNLLLTVASVALSLLAIEGIGRLVVEPRSAGAGFGILNRRYNESQATARAAADRVSRDIPDTATTLVVVGDSLSRGQGVPPTDAFPHRLVSNLGDQFVLQDLSRDGANTRDEATALSSSLATDTTHRRYVIHQYFGNDIDYLTTRQVREAGWFVRPLLALTEISYVADALLQPLLLRSIGRTYLPELFGLYESSKAWAAHVADLDALWGRAHAAGAPVVFIVFPFVHTADVLAQSMTSYVSPLLAHFREVCAPGDAALDVGSLIAADPHAADPSYWTVNRVDAHPSAALHERVALELERFFRHAPGRVEPCTPTRPRPEQTAGALW